MQSTEIKIVDVDEAFLESLWDKVATSGSFYSIGDGITKVHFKKVFYESTLVIELEGGISRFEECKDFVEVHVLVFGHSFYRNAKQSLQDIYHLAAGIFQNKPIRCMIPSEMKGFLRLPEAAGMHKIGTQLRLLTGVPVTCTVFEWRP